MNRLLLVEDNEIILKSLSYMLVKEGFELDCASGYAAALSLAENMIYDLAILDIALPDGSGFELFKELKALRPETPVLFLTAKDEEDDVVYGLNLGADDYVIKPFRNRELLGRIKNILRRYDKADKEIVSGSVRIDLDGLKVFKDDEEVSLTALELRVLTLLFQNKGKVVTRESILDKIWDYAGNVVNDNTLTVYIKRIREKLGDDVIKTVKGLGYRVD